ncbi:hypothetical protein [Paraglaciecola sp. L3A3]|uniref:hypothetical protein n=1 Tax=Paraglaciecola sp. L3A3 TaxID=2686358 RepID=UPI00131CFC99|nr:hypothetical protein [Paraglaciecola sp. L3A3]
MEKNIFIHVGPPKTGTSAVQKWFSENVRELQNLGVFYPSHEVDQNGVSSGNVRTIYDINSEKKIELNLEKLNSLIEKFENSQYHTLLLSSEFFFRGMLELKKYIPKAKFIAYIRNPMEIKESSYNQSVKRHFQQRVLNAGRSQRLPYMDRLVSYVEANSGDDLTIRLYGKQYFENANIVSDVLSLLGINLDVDLPFVNNSYQFEALEFKRWFNQFELEQYQVIVDRTLQAYNEGCSRYSLIPTQQYIEDSRYYSQLIERYALELKTNDLLPLVEDMQDASPTPYLKQELTQDAFLSVCHFLQETLKVDYYLLTRHVGKIKKTKDDRFYELFVSSYEQKYKFLFIVSLFRMKVKSALNLLKRKVNHFRR